MRKIIKKAITMATVCALIVYMSLPVMASHEHSSYIYNGGLYESYLTDHLNYTCTISQLHWIITKQCTQCIYYEVVSKEYRGEIHSKTHP